MKNTTPKTSRMTRQRGVVVGVFESNPRPLAPEEVLNLAKLGQPKVSLSTVYRTIKRLLDDGWLKTVELPGLSPRYEIAGKHHSHHHHFVCIMCDRTYDIEGCGVNLRPLVPRGFKLTDHHLTLFGQCGSCR